MQQPSAMTHKSNHTGVTEGNYHKKFPYLTPLDDELSIRASFYFNTTHAGLSYAVKFGW